MGLFLICNIFFLLRFDGLGVSNSDVRESEPADKQRYLRGLLSKKTCETQVLPIEIRKTRMRKERVLGERPSPPSTYRKSAVYRLDMAFFRENTSLPSEKVWSTLMAWIV